MRHRHPLPPRPERHPGEGTDSPALLQGEVTHGMGLPLHPEAGTVVFVFLGLRGLVRRGEARLGLTAFHALSLAWRDGGPRARSCRRT